MNLTPIRAAVGAVVVLVAAMTLGYLANRGGSSDQTPSGESTTTGTTASTTASTVTGAPTPTPTPTTTSVVPSKPASAEPTQGASASSASSGTQRAARPTPTTTEITSDMGPGAHDGDGE
ncbi:hypothetical protein [Nocardioides cavernaquae]|uniref:Uncharacterized protein n=1 Tax=Nocardioides cavernaquae TaxID=2321396 RepID=A0A3A5H9R1_9ACTN|nr:hypothetical protein [Nocardioides cavernaquae]RJS47363.1 hypothetical protein D4739_14825 [Nocardioides cavernaquae]